MRLLFRSGVFPFIILLLLASATASAKPDPSKYSISFTDSAMLILKNRAVAEKDSFYSVLPLLNIKYTIYNITRTHGNTDKTNDFYLLLILCLLLGFIRYTDRRYFQNLIKAFWNPGRGSRQLKDQLETVPLTNLLMNIFFVASSGAYIYYVGQIMLPQRSVIISPTSFMLMMVGGISGIYIIKYATIKFSGWAFRLQTVTDQYIFNVFLINKIIGIALLPFVVILAFASSSLAHPTIIISLTLAIALFINRYIRSAQAFKSFIKYGRFHFFMYLCASELLPLAVLMKLLVRGLLYY